MKAAVLDRLGALPRFADFAEPDVRDGETLVRVSAAAVKPIDRAIAAGTHYASPKLLPVVCGMDGVGTDARGERAYFMATRRPYGAMAELAPAAWTVPVPDALDTAAAAAVVNPAIAAWLPLDWRGRLEPGQSVLILGATGNAGRMAVTVARLLGAGRVIAAGRNRAVLAGLEADATVDLSLPRKELVAQFSAVIGDGPDVIVDYVWGTPVEALLESLATGDLHAAGRGTPTRLVSVGEMGGGSITLPSAMLRGSRIELLGSGTANMPPLDRMKRITSDILALAAQGRLAVDIETWPIADVAQAWRQAEAAERRPVVTIG
ncbi:MULTISPECIES: quinone oxidoreductase family protein [unclassified Sphingomonas]|uniref:quinone oxidoreductase family protein n=1 Tax=unclassified Sphingomonas TaxID=196159 RepID=UPI0006FA3A8D|nr:MULTISPECIES: zinc-binding alcohol dehydrogenase family protein [unclassified Sphingomonas]KQX23311.1 alcohol dehydrogenase [Sphingomonas sp. Root1294]KQY68159.1 alcohol dehydrogenase [Sphingomonas sp. Root50]KRB91052.1 alcohol dehydrogenase [Sphingomonas sp. Root720]